MFKILRRILFILAAIIVGLILIILLLLFSSKSSYDVPELTNQDYLFQANFIKQEVVSIYKSKPHQLREIVLRPTEVNSILRLVANGHNIKAIFDVKEVKKGASRKNSWQVIFRGGEFEIYHSPKVAHKLLFGGHIPVYVCGIPHFYNNRLAFDATKVQLGRLPFSENWTDQIIEKGIKERTSSREFQAFCDIVKSLEVTPDGDVILIYRPNEVFRYLFKR